MSISKIINLVVAILLIGMGSAYADGTLGASGVGGAETRRIGNVQRGLLLETRPVKIRVESSVAAKATGASIGAAVGGMACKKQDWAIQALCGTVGGVLGGVTGGAVGGSTKEGVEMIVLFETTGELVSIAQEAQGTAIPANGSEVYVATINGMTRVFPVTAPTGKANASANAAYRM